VCPPPCACEGCNNIRHAIALFNKKIEVLLTVKPTVQNHSKKSDTAHLRNFSVVDRNTFNVCGESSTSIKYYKFGFGRLEF